MELHELPKYNGIQVRQLTVLNHSLQSSVDNIQAKESACHSYTVTVYMYIYLVHIINYLCPATVHVLCFAFNQSVRLCCHNAIDS